MILCFWVGEGLLAAGDMERNVLAEEHAWLDGYNRRDAGAVARIEADDFAITFGDGRVQDKSGQLDGLKRVMPRGAKYEIHSEGAKVRIYGTVAVLTGIVTERGSVPGAAAFSVRSRYTDVWVLRRGGGGLCRRICRKLSEWG